MQNGCFAIDPFNSNPREDLVKGVVIRNTCTFHIAPVTLPLQGRTASGAAVATPHAQATMLGQNSCHDHS
eukprot:1001909-Pelagomonas_calceolata.AAC.1